MLEKQISILEDYSDFIKSNLDLIVVDDCSAQVIKLFSIPGINVSIYRTLKDIPWNQDFCRNLAVSKTKTDWMLISDIDNIIPPETLESLLLKIYDSEIAYRFSRINYGDKKKNTVSPNTWFMTKQLYEKVGGYDERLAGLYGTDFDFRKRVRDAAYIIDLDEVIMPVVESDIPDAATKNMQEILKT